MEVFIFVDGGCRLSKKIGSYSSIVLIGNIEDENIIEKYSLEKGFENVTNNQMEVGGCIDTLIPIINDSIEVINNNIDVKINVISDSQYLVSGVNEYLPNWRKNGFKTYSKKSIKNKSLWLLMDVLLDIMDNNKINYEFIWTKGHVGKDDEDYDTYATKYNNIADANCGIIMDKMEEDLWMKNDIIFDNFILESKEYIKEFILNE